MAGSFTRELPQGQFQMLRFEQKRQGTSGGSNLENFYSILDEMLVHQRVVLHTNS